MRITGDFSTLTEETYEQAIIDLSGKDPDIAGVIMKWGNPPFWTHEPGFPGIVIGILAQQVSLESAKATFTKLGKTLDSVNARSFLSLDNDALRAIGFSRQKASYVRAIASSITTGTYDFDDLNCKDNNAVRNSLMELRGIGPWTAEVYLLFSLRRADAWPSGDLALQKAIQELKGVTSTPAPEEADKLADYWKPWRAVAARVLWHYYLCERSRSMPA